ncbi:MAG TPA: glycosyltransferase [Chitinophagaceae bacterium]|nr:glycosyltransferase [Chitinophagaceae bacterium]
MPNPSHIVIACSYLHVPGGYEKAMISTANLFAEKKHRVTLLILDHTAETYYPVHPGIKIIHSPMNFGITEKGNTISRKIKMWQDVRRLKALLKELRPDHLICSEYHFAVGAILAGAKKISRVYSWEHHHYHAQHLNRFWQYFQKRTYKKLDAVICLNADEKRYYRKLNDNTVVIPNFIAQPGSTTRAAKRFDLLSVTRFNPIKGIDLLMGVAKTVLKRNDHLRWKVIGYGEQKEIFLDFINKEGLVDRLIYQPADKVDITGDYQESSLFVMTSRNECFPLVLLEAMNHAVPCIAFDCDTGPRHIIINNETGLLIEKENVERMAASILSLVDDRLKLENMSKRSLQAVVSYYPDKVYALWKALFSKDDLSIELGDRR